VPQKLSNPLVSDIFPNRAWLKQHGQNRKTSRSEHFENKYFKMNCEAKDVNTTNIISQM
jgi:hypothetical protein